jgi:hypothetical protein
MEKIEISKEELIHLVETAIQFGVDFVDVVKVKPSERKRVANWMVKNTIKDLENSKQIND